MKKTLVNIYNTIYWKLHKMDLSFFRKTNVKMLIGLNKRGVFLNAKQKAWKKAILELEKDQIIILETGRSRNPEWAISDGNSTWFFSRWNKIKHLISVDNDTENYSGYSTSEKYCRNYLSSKQLQKITFINGDSRVEIPKLNKDVKLDAVLLDSANDPALILEECKATIPYLNKPAVIIVDDVHGAGIKGELAIPYLEELGYKANYFSAPPNDGCYFIIN